MDDPAINTLLDPYDPRAVQERYEFYARLRSEAPVHVFRSGLDPRRDLCLLTRHADVTGAFRDPRFVREFGLPRYNGPARQAGCPFGFAETIRHWMVYRDPPDHDRLRDPVAAALKAVTSQLAVTVRDVVVEVVGGLPRFTPFDLIERLAFPIPARVICRLVGLADDDLDRFGRWMSAVGRALERSDDGDAWSRADRACVEMTESLLRAHAREGDWTPFIRLVREHDGASGTKDVRETMGNLILLLFAGFETTLNLIANTFLCLLSHPPQLERLRNDMGLCEGAVEETLRYEAPVQTTYRGTEQPIEVRGITIPARIRVAFVLGSANRDERAFPRPDTFDIGRRARNHLAFGHRNHFCPGAMLGRMEATMALQEVFGRFRSVELRTEAPCWRNSLTYRALTELRVEIGGERA